MTCEPDVENVMWQHTKFIHLGKPGNLDLCTSGIAYIIGIYRYQIEGKHFVSIDV
jgi:hypothetical protein